MKNLLIVGLIAYSISLHAMEQESTVEDVTQQLEQVNLQQAATPQQDISARVAQLSAKLDELITLANAIDPDYARPIILVKAASLYFSEAQKLFSESPSAQTQALSFNAQKVYYDLYQQQLLDLVDLDWDDLYEKQSEEALAELNTLTVEYYFTIQKDPTKSDKDKEHLQELLTKARQEAGL